MIYYSTHTHTEKYYLFVSYNKNSDGLLKDFRGMKKEEQVCWRDLCDRPFIDYGQQPMKMHTEVTLFYKYINNVHKFSVAVSKSI